METVQWLKDIVSRAPSGRGIVEAIEAKLHADVEAEALATRQRLVAELKDLEARDLALVTAREPKRAVEEAAADRAKQAFDKAVLTCRHAESMFLEQKWPLERRIQAIRHELEHTAPSIIMAFRQDVLSTLMRESTAARDSVSERTIAGYARVTWSNDESIRKYQEAIQAAGHAAIAMQQEALSLGEVTARLAALRENLPAIERRPTQYQGLAHA